MTTPITATRLRALAPGYPPMKCSDAHRVVAEHGGQVEESTVTLHPGGAVELGEWRPVPTLGVALREVERLRKALQICEHVVHRVEPTEAELHAAQQASGAYRTDWQPEYVYDDLPNFEYRADEAEVGRG